MQKRGQITIFIVLGIILLAAAISFFLVKEQFLEDEIKTKEGKMIESAQFGENVRIYAENCLEDVSKESIIYLAAHGGYEYGSNFSIEYNGEKRPYYFHSNKTFLPGTIDLKKAFNDYLNKELIYCMANLYEAEKGYNLTFPSPNVSTTIIEGKINFQVDFDIVVEKEETQKEFNTFETTIPTSFLTLHNVAKNITLTQTQYLDFIVRSNLIDLAEKHNLKIETTSISESDVIYEIIDENNKINGDPLVYSFAFKYNWEDNNSTGGEDEE